MSTELINMLAEHGVLALLLAISISLNFYLIKILLAEKDKRIEEAGKVTTSIVEPMAAIRDNVAALIEAAVRRKR